MKNTSLIWIMLAGFLLAFVASSVHAEVGLTSNHVLLIADSFETETEVTLELTITNTGTIALTQIVLAGVPLTPSTNTLTIDSLPVGSEVITTWHMTLPITEQISSIFLNDLNLNASVTDVDGGTTDMQVLSKGGTE